jgi:predicted ATP-binding protein involved in virulence
MKINYLRLRHYKCFEELELNLSSQYNLHVFLAENMAGKTAILKAMRIALSARLQKIVGPSGNMKIAKDEHQIIGDTAFANIANDVEIEIHCQSTEWIKKQWQPAVFKWKKYKESFNKNAQTTTEPIFDDVSLNEDIRTIAQKSYNQALKGEDNGVNPLLLYVGAEYLYQAKPQTDNFESDGQALQGYWYCLEDKNMKNYVLEWLNTLNKTIREQAKNEIANEYYGDLAKNTIKIFEIAIQKLLPDILVITWVYDTLKTSKNQHDAADYVLCFNIKNEGIRTYDMLSDGYKYLILLLGELITRATLLNKHLGENVLAEITGVVLIDEFGVHLHPKLQAAAIKGLGEIIPNVQFIVTTHSPLLVGGLAKEQIHILEIDQDRKRVLREATTDAKGLDADGILTQFFDLEYTYDKETYEQMLRRRQLLAKKKFDKANFTAKESDELQNLTIKVSDYTDNYADGLFLEFVHELDKVGGLAAYRNIEISDEQKQERQQQANALLEKIKQTRLK